MVSRHLSRLEQHFLFFTLAALISLPYLPAADAAQNAKKAEKTATVTLEISGMT